MPWRDIRVPWESQPQEAVELSDRYGAIAAVLPMNGVVRNVSRYEAEPFAVATGSNIDTQPAQLGYGAGSTSQHTDAYRLHSVVNRRDTVWERPTDGVTVLAYFVRTGNPGGGSPIFHSSSPSTPPYIGWGLSDNASATAEFACSPGGSLASCTHTGGLSNNVPTVLVGLRNGTEIRLFQNGASVASTSCGSGALAYPNDNTAQGPCLGNFWNYTGGNRSFVGRIFLAALWDRALSANEVAELSANPWSLFQPRTQRIWTAASTGLPTLSSATYVPGSLTSSGFKPRVTATY